ncbi:hypothetical protein [Phormidium tenue]|uniref:Uncharacterized protein n=1 Tax=Phormidium tenue NIES-30 TaxID=549789 RepID=A0A1U7J335_9CYAN|nr:hypothetical protein [Phormidium tenue]MBD2233201.1 hypothetical protein [Phormidium tenue FACHB-1052]OKH46620.1 hypothetical protein NIES30_16120 [Phormidium tenue NIES-30]
MPSKIQPLVTSQFTERSPLVALGALGLLGMALLISPLFHRQLLSAGVYVGPEETVQLDPVQPREGAIGALRIDAVAQLPSNAWSVFEVQVLDSQGNVLASAIKQAWNESGTWQEEGESGVWQEQDQAGRFDIRQAAIDGPVVVAISVLEQGSSTGQPLDSPVVYRVTVAEGVIDTRFLWSGAIGVLLVAALTAIAVKAAGQTVINEQINDSDLVGRGTLGGPSKLVRVIITVKSDETSPPKLTANLAINDSYGESVYRREVVIPLSMEQEEGKVESASGSATVDLVLEPRGSYGFSVEITPDGPVDHTFLTVKEGIRTFTPTEITHIQLSTEPA